MQKTVRQLGGMEPDRVLRASGLAGDLPHDDLLRLAEQLTPHELRAGDTLFEQGDHGDALFLVRRGRLRVERTHDGHRTILGEVGPAAYVGEMALVSGEARGATVRAARDTSLLRMDLHTLETLVQRSPRTGLLLARVVIERAVQTSTTPEPGDWSFALSLAHDDGLLNRIADEWIATMRQRTGTVVIDRVDPDRPPDLDHLELIAEHLVFDLRKLKDRSARRWALRQSDRCVVLERDHVARDTEREREIVTLARPDVPLDHILLRHPAPGQHCPPYGDGGRDYQRYRHDGSADSLHRIVRNQTSSAISLALSGGAIRGLAHLGVHRAWTDAGFVIDRIAGTSAGAITAATLAHSKDPDELLAPIERFLRTPLLSLLNPPLVSALSGREIAGILHKVIPDIHIEDSPIPLHIVCADLVSAQRFAPRTGSLRLLARASSSLPGIWPPVPLDGRLLVDGGIFDNLPASELTRWTGGGFITAVDVSGQFAHPDIPPDAHTVSGWTLLRQRIAATLLRPFGVRRTLALPTLNALDTVVRASTLASERQYRQAIDHIADCTIRPDIPPEALGNVRQRGALQQIIQASRDHTMRILDALPEERREQLAGKPQSPFASRS
ncbi:MAG: hypothetical protein EA398_01180 [Deltaproteobacteria bacterium]|nr:MAG: hypothetical protein EA398_01180 [Deltaproteobacteria bacterium]